MSQYKLPVYTPEELEAANSYPPLENGRFKFRVLERKQGFSKANNPQEQLVLDVQHKPNKTKKCWKNFTFNNPGDPGHLFLIKIAKDFLDCVGVEYNEDSFDRVENREGVADFFVEEYTNKKGETREKFIVPNEGFISPDDLNKPTTSTTQVGAAPAPQPAKSTESFDDDIPF